MFALPSSFGIEMIAITTVLVALLVSLLITRVATIALTVTGLSREAARFQARSAFTGVGFTTSEAESVVNHPVRRRVVLVLMLLGNAGLVTIVASLLISFTRAEESVQAWRRIGLLLLGLTALFLLARSKRVDRALSHVITRLLGRFTDLDARDYAELLQLAGGYGVIELEVQPTHWIAGKSLEDLQLRQEGIAVLGVERKDGTFIGVPKGATVINEGDVMVLYGHTRVLSEIGRREAGREGDEMHRLLVERHEGIVDENSFAERQSSGG